MNKLLTILTMLVFTAIFNACGDSGKTNSTSNASNATNTTKTEPTKTETTKVDDSKWTSSDKENAIKGCKFGRQKDDPAKVEKLCACYLNKVIALSPNPVEQSKIPMSDVTKLNSDCAKEAGL